MTKTTNTNNFSDEEALKIHLKKMIKKYSEDMNQLKEKIVSAQKMLSTLGDDNDSFDMNNFIDEVPALKKVKQEEENEKSEKDFFGGYPKGGTKEEKILFIIRRKNKATRIPDVAEIIENIEGSKLAEETLKNLDYSFKKLVRERELKSAKISNSKKHVFFILPEYLNKNLELIAKHYPDDDSWGKLEEEKREEIYTAFKYAKA